MGCPDNSFKYLSSEANAKDKLLKAKVIDQYDRILDFELFKQKAVEFKNHASELLKTDVTSVITGVRDGFVKYDKEVFRKIDKLRGYDKINAENIRKQLAELEKKEESPEEIYEKSLKLSDKEIQDRINKCR